MEEPLQIVFQGLDTSETFKAQIEEKSKKLERFYHHIIDAQVIVSKDDDKPHVKGNQYHVTIEVNVPGKRLVVKKSPGRRFLGLDDLQPALNDAFRAMFRRLEEYGRKQRGDVKQHDMPPEGRVNRLFPEAGYGFITMTDGREVYFHENSVIGKGFEALEEGDPVRAVVDIEESPKGPQASTVERISEMKYVADADAKSATG